MFYSNGKINNANSIFPPLPPFFSLYQHQQDLTTNGHDLLPASLSAPPALETTNSCYSQTMINNWNDHVKNSEPFTTNLQFPARKLIKKRAAGAHSTKDRLRKIVTAQGPRDRRVRLSIQIARKFFDLQDTLGFDKPSKTLDWLLTKSKAAIDELALVKPTATCSITSSTVDHHEAQATRQLKTNKALMSSTEKSITAQQQQQQQNNPGFGDFARESRAKARERARERTKGKRSSKTLNIESKQLLLHHCVPSIQPNHSTTWNQIKSSHNNRTPYFNADRTTHQFTTNSLLNVSNSKLYSDFPRATENWDISQSFTLVNPSTADLQNCNKLEEIYNYQIMS